MSELSADIIVLGSGFGGSLTALILNRIGRSVIVVDRQHHPRFAIGESSTPIADAILSDLADRYDLPALKPLSQYGTWKKSYPEINCGLKRGFSYFRHGIGQPFRTDDANANQLIVAASSDNHQSDTHWYRADVDAFFARQVRESGIPCIEGLDTQRLVQSDNWCLKGRAADADVRIHAGFVVDATGVGGALSKALGIRDVSDQLRTNSRAVFGHFRGVAPWSRVMAQSGLRTDHHPFDCDAAALHQVFDDGWMWQLRFDNDITSAGFVLDSRTSSTGKHPLSTRNWHDLLSRQPSISNQFDSAWCVAPESGPQSTGRLQRLSSMSSGARWAMLPNTAGFIDPLHSTGIAHSLCGIERLTRTIDECWSGGELPDRLAADSAALRREFELIDLLVEGCYASLRDFDLFAAWCMLYFTAAIRFEHQRAEAESESTPHFLCADDREFVRTVRALRQRLDEAISDGDSSGFARDVAAAIQPWNIAGLCDPAVHNMYRYTAAPR